MALLNPYLNFRGNAREAIEFYHSVFGGHLDISTFGEFQMPGTGPDEQDSVMHAQLTTSSGFTLMASDVPPGMPYRFCGCAKGTVCGCLTAAAANMPRVLPAPGAAGFAPMRSAKSASDAP